MFNLIYMFLYDYACIIKISNSNINISKIFILADFNNNHQHILYTGSTKLDTVYLYRYNNSYSIVIFIN